MTRALITGVTGQDGSYLAELLLAQGYEVHGVTRDAGEVVTPGVVVHERDLSVDSAIGDLITELQPREIYNLAALSSVYQSWQNPALTARLNGVVVAEMLAAVKKIHDHGQIDIRFVQASSAEIFGAPSVSPQDESTPVRPTSPYGAAKAYAHGLVGAYRTAGVSASSVILYNHESPRRPETFVTSACKTLSSSAISMLDAIGGGHPTTLTRSSARRSIPRLMILSLQREFRIRFVTLSLLPLSGRELPIGSAE